MAENKIEIVIEANNDKFKKTLADSFKWLDQFSYKIKEVSNQTKEWQNIAKSISSGAVEFAGSSKDVANSFSDQIDNTSKLASRFKRFLGGYNTGVVSFDKFNKSLKNNNLELKDADTFSFKFGQRWKQVDQTLMKSRMNFLGIGFLFASIGKSISSLFNEESSLISISQRMADVVGKGLGNAVAEGNAKFAEFKMELMSALAPALIAATDALTTLMGWLQQLLTLPFVKELLGWLAVFAPIISVIGFLIVGIGSIVAVIGGPLTIAIFAAVAIFTFLATNWDAIVKFILDLGAWLAKGWMDFWKSIFDFVKFIWDSIVAGVTSFIGFIWDGIKRGLDWIGQLWTSFWTGASQFLTNIWNGIIDIISSGINGVIGWINGLIDVWNAAFGGIGLGIGRMGGVNMDFLKIPTAQSAGTTNEFGGINVNVATGPVSSQVDMDALAKAIGEQVANSVRQEVRLV